MTHTILGGDDPAAAIATLYGFVFLNDFSRYAVWSIGAFLLISVVFRRSLEGRKIRAESPPGAQMRREFLASTRTAAIFALTGSGMVLGKEAGITKIYDDPAALGWGYFAVSLTGVIILHDAWFYWTHRLIHDPRLFRGWHRLHHRSHNPSPFTAYSFDIGEAALNAAFVLLAAAVIPLSWFAIMLFMTHMIARNVIGHSGYELFPARRSGRPLFDFLTTVTHHDLHHAQAGWNYGLYFTWWDRLMGTEHPLYHEKFAEAVRKPLDGSAVRALAPTASLRSTLLMLPAVAIAAFAVAPAGRAGAAANPTEALASVEGVWATEGHGAHVALERCADDGTHLCGRLIWSWDPAIETRQKDRLMIGDFVWNGEAFEQGWLANPEDGRTYRGRIRLTAEGALDLKGCALVFCKSQIWRRVEDIPGCGVEIQ